MNPGILSRACLAVTALLFAGSSAYATTAALDGLRGETLQRQDARRGTNDYPGTCLHLANLVHAGNIIRS